jgi:hypothetical protein
VAISTKYQVKVRKVALRSEFLTKQPHLALRTEFWAKLPNLAVRWEFPAKLGKAGAMYPNVGCSKQRGKKSAEHRATCYVENNMDKSWNNVARGI